MRAIRSFSFGSRVIAAAAVAVVGAMVVSGCSSVVGRFRADGRPDRRVGVRGHRGSGFT